MTRRRQPAINAIGTGTGPYLFQFPRPAAGTIQFAWAAGNGITDLAPAPNAFAGGNWTNTLDPAYSLPTIRINEFLASNIRFPTTSSPDAANFLPPVDTDGDGLSDAWEIAHGTDPQDSMSRLKLEAKITVPDAVTLQFQAVSNHTYGVLYQNSLAAATWLVLTNVASRNTNWTETIVDPAIFSTNRFYRLVTPQ